MSKKTSFLISISNNLMVENVEDTLGFYCDIGFNIIDKFPESGPAYWAYVKKNNIELFFQSKKSLTEEFPELKEYGRGGALTLWFRVDNIINWYAELRDKTGIIRPFGITDYNGAKEFVVRDINGFILHFSDFDLIGEITKRKT